MEGTYVRHPTKPEWGVGKVYCFKAGYALVGFEHQPEGKRMKRFSWKPGLLVPANDVTAHPLLDKLSPICTADCRPIPQSRGRTGGVVRPVEPVVAELTFGQAYERFLTHYPGGFRDGPYPRLEREWKLSKTRLWRETVGEAGLRSLAEAHPEAAARLILKVIQTSRKPLLHPKGEIVLMRDALAHVANLRPYLDALADLLEADSVEAATFERHLQALTSLPLGRPGDLGKCPIVTVLPFLVQPERHMFFKPSPTNRTSRMLGVDLLYSSRPNWGTYERRLDFGHDLLQRLRPHGAEDMIDVQSFVWAIAL